MFFTINSFKTFVAADVGGYRNQNPNMWHQAWIERVLFPAVVLMHQGALRQIHMSFCPGARVVAVKASETMKALSILSYWSQDNHKISA